MLPLPLGCDGASTALAEVANASPRRAPAAATLRTESVASELPARAPGAAPSCSQARIDTASRKLNTPRRKPGAMPPPSCIALSQAPSVFTSCTVGTTERPLCSHADTATACQCATFFVARSPSRRSTERSHIKGCIAYTPNSAAFSTNASMRSLAGMPMASVTCAGSSRSLRTACSTRTCTTLRPISETVASHSLPCPSNRCSGSPGCMRSTCTCLDAASGKASTCPVLNDNSLPICKRGNTTYSTEQPRRPIRRRQLTLSCQLRPR
jgi:hypothetical protein